MRSTDLVGLGMTEMSLRGGDSAVVLACRAIGAALADAGCTRSDIDGLLVGSSQGFGRSGWGRACRAGRVR